MLYRHAGWPAGLVRATPIAWVKTRRALHRCVPVNWRAQARMGSSRVADPAALRLAAGGGGVRGGPRRGAIDSPTGLS